MKTLGLDISTKAGWAIREGSQLVAFGRIELGKTVHSYGKYPWNFIAAANEMAQKLMAIIIEHSPNVIVIEETNLGKNRYAQKTLEFIHKAILDRISEYKSNYDPQVVYLSSSSWRKSLGLVMSKDDKKNNQKLAKASKTAVEWGQKLDKKSLGVKGKVTKKHLALRYVNTKYNMQLKVKDNDIADAICLVDAFEAGAEQCDGVM